MAFSIADTSLVSYQNVINRGSGGTPISVPAPAGLAVGDYYVIWAHAGSIGAGTGWTNSASMTRLTDLGANPGRSMVAFGRYVTDSTVLAALATVTITPGSTTATRAGAIGQAIRGLDPASPFSDDTAWVVYSSATTTITNPTPPTGDTVLWGMYASGASTTTHPIFTPSGGGTKVAQVTSFNASPGTYSETTGISTTAQSSTVMGVIQGGTGATLASSAGTAGVIGIGLVNPTVVVPEIVTPKFASVLDLKQYGMGAPWAHRLGPWTEMSEDSGNKAVALGYQVLEFSAHVTSDDVWYGLHDNTRNRTSQTTGLPAANTETWATVSASLNTLNDPGAGQPYYRLDSFLDKFVVGQGRIAVVDPKEAAAISGTVRTQFLDLLDAHGGPTKIVVKYAGNGGVAAALFTAARARGYECWGYFYDTQLNDGPPSTYDNWNANSDWIGMGLIPNLIQSEWNTTLATAAGRPVVGHIAYSKAEYDAVGSMVLASPNYSGQTWMVQTSRIDLVPAVGMPVRGVVSASGTATVGTAETRTATGTVTAGGTATAFVAFTRTADGTVAASGTATRSVNEVRSATGTLTVSGTATAFTVFTRTSVGTLTASGTATQAVQFVRNAVGTVTATGTGLLSVKYTLTATGILTVSGTADAGGALTRDAIGTLLASGAAIQVVVLTRTATGSVVASGTAVAVGASVTRTALGTLTVSGTAAVVARYALTATGILNLTGTATVETAGGSVVRTALGTLTVSGSAATSLRVYLTAFGVLTASGLGIVGTGTVIPEYRTLRILSGRYMSPGARRTLKERKP